MLHQEAPNREIDLSDDDEKALNIMLQYLYTYEISNLGLTTATSLQLLIVGDKYELEEVRDAGKMNLSNKIASLTSSDGQWAADWYPQISQLQQRGAEVLAAKLTNTIAKHAREMIKHDAIRALVANDGALAVLLVERLASPMASIFEKPKEATDTDWLGVPGFRRALRPPSPPLPPQPRAVSPARTTETFGGTWSPTTTPF